jgi:hypothetical protein
LHVVDADLQIFEAGAVQALDALGCEQITVGDQAGEHAAAAHVRDEFVELRMQQRLAAADGDHRGAHVREQIDAAFHFVDRHRVREIVEFVAVGAGQIAAADRDDVNEQGMARGEEAPGHAAQFARARAQGTQSPPHFDVASHKLETLPL